MANFLDRLIGTGLNFGLGVEPPPEEQAAAQNPFSSIRLPGVAGPPAPAGLGGGLFQNAGLSTEDLVRGLSGAAPRSAPAFAEPPALPGGGVDFSQPSRQKMAERQQGDFMDLPAGPPGKPAQAASAGPAPAPQAAAPQAAAAEPAAAGEKPAHQVTVRGTSGTTTYDYARDPSGGLSQSGPARFVAEGPPAGPQDLRGVMNQVRGVFNNPYAPPSIGEISLAQSLLGSQDQAAHLASQERIANLTHGPDAQRQQARNSLLDAFARSPNPDPVKLNAMLQEFNSATEGARKPTGVTTLPGLQGGGQQAQSAAGAGPAANQNTQSATGPGVQAILGAEAPAAQIKKLLEGGTNRGSATQVLDLLANSDPATQAELIRRIMDQNLVGDTTAFGDNVVKSHARTLTAINDPTNSDYQIPGQLGLPGGVTLQQGVSPARAAFRMLAGGFEPSAAYNQASVNNGKRLVPIETDDVSGPIERLRMSPAERQAAQKRSEFGAELIRQLTARGKYAQ